MRANLIYERLKGRARLTPLEERLCLVVWLKQQAQRFVEMQIIAESGRDEHNSKALSSLLTSYQKQLFPGIETPQESWERQAKKLLAEEVKKLYIVKPLQGKKRAQSLQRSAASPHPGVRQWAEDELKRSKQAQRRLADTVRRRRGTRALPEGVIKEER